MCRGVAAEKSKAHNCSSVRTLDVGENPTKCQLHNCLTKHQYDAIALIVKTYFCRFISMRDNTANPQAACNRLPCLQWPRAPAH
eukprot:scaffold86992_cov20-Tisochrysis_lutea.AAC.2